VIQDPKTGKYYFVTETDSAKLSSFTKSGNFQDALAQGLIKEASAYQPSTEGMKIYPDKDGNATVVDENGKPVESPPAVIQDPATGKYYFITETDPAKLSSLAKGNFKDALAQGLIKEASTYQPSWWDKKSV
jgi:general stress protein 26